MAALTPESWRAVSPYLEKALGLAEEERAAFITSLQHEHPIAAMLLQSLLEEQSALAEERFLEQTPAAWSGPAGFAGEAVGAYTLVSLLGQGGMGTVWLAERNDGVLSATRRSSFSVSFCAAVARSDSNAKAAFWAAWLIRTLPSFSTPVFQRRGNPISFSSTLMESTSTSTVTGIVCRLKGAFAFFSMFWMLSHTPMHI